LNGLIFNNNVKIVFIISFSILIFFFSFIFYVNHLTTRFEYDSIEYALQLEEGKLVDIFHPHHLLYNYFKWLIYNLLKNNGFIGRSLLVSQVFNAFFGALGISFLFLTVIFITKDFFVSLLSSIFLCFCYGYWYCSVFGGVRVMGVSFLILTFGLLVYSIFNEERSFLKNIFLFVLISIFHSLAIFSHQTNAMFIIVVITGLFFKRDTFFKKIIYLVLYSVVLFIIVAGLYCYIGITVYHLRSIDKFYLWLTSYTRVETWGKLTTESLPLTANGIKTVFIGSLYKNDVFFGPIKNKDIVNIFIYSLWFIGIYFVLFSYKILKKYLVVVLMCLIWLLFYVLFFIWWEPGNFEFWISSLPPFIILISLSVSDLLNKWKFFYLKVIWKAIWGFIFSVLVFLFLCYNFFGSILPHCDVKKSRYFNIIDNLKHISKSKDDLIIVMGKDALDRNILYFAPRDYISIYKSFVMFKGDESATYNYIEAKVKDKIIKNKEVFIFKDVLKLKDFEIIKQRYPNLNESSLLDFIKDKFELTPLSDENGFWFYKVKLK